jgi:hypothetical protein
MKGLIVVLLFLASCGNSGTAKAPVIDSATAQKRLDEIESEMRTFLDSAKREAKIDPFLEKDTGFQRALAKRINLYVVEANKLLPVLKRDTMPYFDPTK